MLFGFCVLTQPRPLAVDRKGNLGRLESAIAVIGIHLKLRQRCDRLLTFGCQLWLNAHCTDNSHIRSDIVIEGQSEDCSASTAVGNGIALKSQSRPCSRRQATDDILSPIEHSNPRSIPPDCYLPSPPIAEIASRHRQSRPGWP
jgi:hypothetical protein